MKNRAPYLWAALAALGTISALLPRTEGAASADAAPPLDLQQFPTVSLTFDDSHFKHRWAAELLSRRGMLGTFFVNSPRIGNEGYLGKEDLLEIEALGHEIGGHTLHHTALGELEEDAQLREICDDRAQLLSWGLSVRSLAYPFNSYDSTTFHAAERCGYVSARGAAGIAAPGSCAGCPPAEFIPPMEPYRIRSFPSYQEWMGIETIKEAILSADGGWLVFIFHDFCDELDCASPYAIPRSDFRELVEWMVTRGVETRTISEMAPGPILPPVHGPPVELPERVGKNLLRNPGFLGDLDQNGMPDCWMEGGYGDRAGSLRHVRQGGIGFTRVAIEELSSGDHKLLSDRGPCAPEGRAGQRFRAAVRYRARGDARLVSYYRSAEGQWIWWAQSPPLEPRAQWGWSHWETPALPTGASALQLGLSLRSEGWADARYMALEPLETEPSGSSCASAPLGLLFAGLMGRRFATKVSGV